MEQKLDLVLEKLDKGPETQCQLDNVDKKMSLVLEKLDKGSKASIKNEAEYSVDDCSQSFQTHILPAYPIFEPVDLDTAKKLIDTSERPASTKRQKTGEEPMQRAEALLVYASGRLCCGMAKGERGVSAQGRETFMEAMSLMKRKQGGQNIRANILAAIYSLLLCRGEASVPYVEMAGSMLVESAENRFVYLKDATPAEVVASEDNKFLILYWTCFMMER